MSCLKGGGGFSGEGNSPFSLKLGERRHVMKRHIHRLGTCLVLVGCLIYSTIAFAQTLTIVGQLTAQESIILSTEKAAKIKKIHFKESEIFKKGAVLASFNCAVDEAKLKKARALHDVAKRRLETIQGLRKFNSSTELEVDMANAEVAKAVAEVEIGRAVVRQCQLKAPFSGKVSKLIAKDHEFLNVSKPVMEIINDQTLNVEFLAPSLWLKFLKVGLKFSITVRETGQSYTAILTRIGAQVDPVSHSVKVVGLIDYHDVDLLAGMTADVIMPSDILHE